MMLPAIPAIREIGIAAEAATTAVKILPSACLIVSFTTASKILVLPVCVYEPPPVTIFFIADTGEVKPPIGAAVALIGANTAANSTQTTNNNAIIFFIIFCPIKKRHDRHK